METKVKNNSTVNKAVGNNTSSKTSPATEAQKVNNLPISTAFNDKKEEPKKEEPKTEIKPEAVKADAPKAEAVQPQANAEPAKQAEQPKAEQAQPQPEPSKKELKEQYAAQQARRLEDTVKLVEQLGKKIAQKRKLQQTIENLDSFTVAQNDEKDDMASDSRFARCELTISDDNGNEFVTKNPFIITYVAHEVRQLCIDKLAEVEASIIIP